MKWMRYERSRYSAVGITTGRQRTRSSSPGGGEIFLFSTSSGPVLGPTQSPIKWIPGIFPGVKRPRSEADHLPPTSAEVKKTWVYTSTRPYAFMA
jgi:hypothetical protein